MPVAPALKAVAGAEDGLGTPRSHVRLARRYDAVTSWAGVLLLGVPYLLNHPLLAVTSHTGSSTRCAIDVEFRRGLAVGTAAGTAATGHISIVTPSWFAAKCQEQAVTLSAPDSRRPCSLVSDAPCGQFDLAGRRLDHKIRKDTH